MVTVGQPLIDSIESAPCWCHTGYIIRACLQRRWLVTPRLAGSGTCTVRQCPRVLLADYWRSKLPGATIFPARSAKRTIGVPANNMRFHAGRWRHITAIGCFVLDRVLPASCLLESRKATETSQNSSHLQQVRNKAAARETPRSLPSTKGSGNIHPGRLRSLQGSRPGMLVWNGCGFLLNGLWDPQPASCSRAGRGIEYVQLQFRLILLRLCPLQQQLRPLTAWFAGAEDLRKKVWASDRDVDEGQ